MKSNYSLIITGKSCKYSLSDLQKDLKINDTKLRIKLCERQYIKLKRHADTFQTW